VFGGPNGATEVAEELSDRLHERIKEICALGDDLQEQGDFAMAILRYEEAFALLPEPKADWAAATWIMAALADAHFFAGDWAACREAVQYAFKFCPGALENAFFHLRAGQAYFELGDIEGAKQWLASAWMLEGDELFDRDDPKYWRFIRELLRPPADEVGEGSRPAKGPAAEQGDEADER
jgi:tetratricopeptide (TPR) repeat protein